MASKYGNIFKTGDKIGKWTVLEENLGMKNGEVTILCKCDCSIEKYVICSSLKKGLSKGCFKCGHGKKGEKNIHFKGYKEIPGSWFGRYSNRSKKFEFNITIEDVYNKWIKQDKKCALSGIDINFKNTNSKKTRHRYDLVCTASLDRIDSKKGYLINNIQLVHKDINMMKKEYNQDYFIEMCRLVYSNSK